LAYRRRAPESSGVDFSQHVLPVQRERGDLTAVQAQFRDSVAFPPFDRFRCFSCCFASQTAMPEGSNRTGFMGSRRPGRRSSRAGICFAVRLLPHRLMSAHAVQDQSSWGGDANLKLRDVAEIAALASAHSSPLIEGANPLPEHPLREFWNQSRQRLHAWMRRLERYPAEFESANRDRQTVLWQQLEVILAEILVCELLTRVWTAVLSAADQKRGVCVTEPIARSILLGQMKARQLALNVMANGPYPRRTDIVPLNRLRCRSERWTDMLLGHLVAQYELADFAFDTDRALDFGRAQLSQGVRDPKCQIWKLIHAGLRIAYPDAISYRLAHPDHHRRITVSVIATFDDDASLAVGPFQSVLQNHASLRSTREKGPAAKLLGEFDAQPPCASLPDSDVRSPGINFAALRRVRRRDAN
jgi:hypothetical protein